MSCYPSSPLCSWDEAATDSKLSEFVNTAVLHHAVSGWTLRIGVPNTMKLVQGLTVTLVSFVIIVRADTIIELLKDFTTLVIISETDNILYQLAIPGYLGEQLHQEALQIEQKAEQTNVMDVDERHQSKKSGLAYVRLVFLLLLGAMFGGWGH